jgi:CelD/BcsL family acetyltransferase involved in cellulose biosynthesis
MLKANMAAPAHRHSQNLHVTTVRDFEALAAHAPAWDRLAWEAPQKVPMLLPAWVEVSLRHGLNHGEEWLCSFAYLGEKLIGVLPIILTPDPILGKGWPTLRMADKHSQSGDMLLAPDHAAVAFQTLLGGLRQEVPTHLGLELKAVRRNSPLWAAIRNSQIGYITRCGSRQRYSCLSLGQDFDSYLGTLGNMRRNLKRYMRKLESRGDVSVEMMRGSAATEDFLEEFLALEASGWKGRAGSAILNKPDAVAFYTALVRNFAADERLEWHAIRVQGRLVAAEMGFRCGPSLMLPKIAFDEDFKDCMPGNLLTAEVIKDALSRSDLTEINHLSQADWHRSWHLESDEYIDLYFVRKDILPVMFLLSRLFLVSRAGAMSPYKAHVKSWIPKPAKTAYRQMRSACGQFRRRLS